MVSYSYTKIVNAERLQTEIYAGGLTTISHIDTVDSQVFVFFPEELSPSDINTLNGLVAGHLSQTTDEYLRQVLANAKAFGESLITDYTVENMKLGITQDNMTNTVRKATKEVVSALTSGSLKDALYELRAIPPENKDSKYITDVRILSTINKIEAYLGLPISSSL